MRRSRREICRRTPQRAAAAHSERTAALVHQLVDQLGQMRGAAMKVGQMLSMLEFDGLEEGEQDELQRKLPAEYLHERRQRRRWEHHD